MNPTKARSMALRDAKNRLSEAIGLAQGTYLLITRHGRPAAVLVGVEGFDTLDVAQGFAEFSADRLMRLGRRKIPNRQPG